jgi:conjugal transfer ATP-binding protein TraC
MLANVHPDFARERLSSHFVYESYDEVSKLFFNRGSIGFVLKGWPLVGTNLQAQNEISEFLKSEDNLPAGSSFQVMMIGTNNVDLYLDRWASFRQGEIFQTLAKRRIEFLKKQARLDGTIKDTFVLIAVTVPIKEVDELTISEMERRKEITASMFASIGLHTSNVDGAELLRILRMFFGWSKYHSDLNPHEVIAEQILRGDFTAKVEKDRILIQGDDLDELPDQAIVALEAMRRPPSWNLAMMNLFLGNEMRRGEQIKSDFILSFGLTMLPSQTLETSHAMAKRETLAKNLKSGLLKWLPNLEEEYKDMDAAVVALQEGERMVVINQTIILKDDPLKIKERQYEYRSMMRRNGFEFVPCSNDHIAVLLASLPMQLVEKTRGTFRVL